MWIVDIRRVDSRLLTLFALRGPHDVDRQVISP